MAFWVHTAAEWQPDRVAIEGRQRSLSYSELARAAFERAGTVRQLVGADEGRIALALPPGEDFLIALHACLLAGVAAVPIDLRWGEEERQARMAGARAVISEPLRPSPHGMATVFAGDRPVAVMHTSGTTAAPKPVVLTHGNFQASALGSAIAIGLDHEERWLCAMPLTHVGGLSIPIRSAIYGTTVVLHERFDTAAVLEELMDPRRRITMVSLVPTMLSRLLDAGLERPPTLRWALLGGGPLPEPLLTRARAAGLPVAPTYGMTEACSQIATFGWPLPGVHLRLDGDGEILVRGPIVCAGAVGDDGWLHTGDLGRLDERGRLTIAGRRSDAIISGGENIAPAEIEAVLLEHPGVADAAVFGRPDPEWGEALHALVVKRDGCSVDEAQLRALCARRLARFKVPKEFSFADSLPRTASGKLLRRSLHA